MEVHKGGREIGVGSSELKQWTVSSLFKRDSRKTHFRKATLSFPLLAQANGPVEPDTPLSKLIERRLKKQNSCLNLITLQLKQTTGCSEMVSLNASFISCIFALTDVCRKKNSPLKNVKNWDYNF